MDGSTTAGQSVAGFLEALASAEPAPGGGAAAALSVSLAAALVAMVCRLTRTDDPRVADALAACDRLRHLGLDLADRDGAAYLAVRAAYRLPKSDPDRAAAVQAALAAAAEVPLATGRVALAVLTAAEGIRDAANRTVASDVDVAVLLARAGAEAAAHNVTANTVLLADRVEAARLDAEMAATLEDVFR